MAAEAVDFLGKLTRLSGNNYRGISLVRSSLFEKYGKLLVPQDEREKFDVFLNNHNNKNNRSYYFFFLKS